MQASDMSAKNVWLPILRSRLIDAKNKLNIGWERLARVVGATEDVVRKFANGRDCYYATAARIEAFLDAYDRGEVVIDRSTKPAYSPKSTNDNLDGLRHALREHKERHGLTWVQIAQDTKRSLDVIYRFAVFVRGISNGTEIAIQEYLQSPVVAHKKIKPVKAVNCLLKPVESKEAKIARLYAGQRYDD